MKKKSENPLTIDFQSFEHENEVKIEIIHIPESHEDFLALQEAFERLEKNNE